MHKPGWHEDACLCVGLFWPRGPHGRSGSAMKANGGEEEDELDGAWHRARLRGGWRCH